MTPFRDQLKTAKYRGFPFVLTEGSAKFGRRNAVHEYPKRDVAWIEDMGRQARRITVHGFIVGDDVIARRDRLLGLVELEGDGELVHSTLGTRKVALMDFTINETWDHGRRFNFTFEFIEQGGLRFPSNPVNAPASVARQATVVRAAAKAALVTKAKAKPSAALTRPALSRLAGFAQRARALAGRATTLINLARGLPGSYGRVLALFDGAGVASIATAVTGLGSVGVTLASLAGASVAARAAVAEKANVLSNVTDLALAPAAVQDLITAVRAAATTPGDALQSLLALTVSAVQTVEGAAAQALYAATDDLLRRTAAAEVAAVAAAYTPVSSEDAIRVRDATLAVLDAEVLLAGDQGEDEVYQALRELRTRVAAALNAAGAKAPEMREVVTASPLPALVLAQRLYRDGERADGLVDRARPRHPAFMPTRFKAPAL